MDIDKIALILEENGIDSNLAHNIACLADMMTTIEEDSPQEAAMDHTKPSEFTYMGKDGENYSISLGPTYPYQ